MSRPMSRRYENFAGAREAEGYRVFAARAARIRNDPRLHLHARVAAQPLGAEPAHRLAALARHSGDFSLRRTLWGALGSHFRDPRLATIVRTLLDLLRLLALPRAGDADAGVGCRARRACGSSKAGMIRLAEALAGFAASLGVRFRYGARVERIVVENGRARGGVRHQRRRAFRRRRDSLQRRGLGPSLARARGGRGGRSDAARTAFAVGGDFCGRWRR